MRLTKDIPNPPVSRKKESKVLALPKTSFDESHISTMKSVWSHYTAEVVVFFVGITRALVFSRNSSH